MSYDGKIGKNMEDKETEKYEIQSERKDKDKRKCMRIGWS